MTRRQRLRVAMSGTVRGVAFRPFVDRLAGELGLPGWVANGAQGLVLEVEGERPVLERFLERLATERPASAVVRHASVMWLEPVGYESFVVKGGDAGGPGTVH